jgi:flagellar hook assembly protein FlgD
MKRILLLLFTALMLTTTTRAQLYNNEWIDYNKTYYKFKLKFTGLCRISQPTLAALGLGAVNADHFQLWRNGQQVPVYTSVQGASLGASDFIEFWGEQNDGKPDLPMYREVDYAIGNKYSLQTDSSTYYLTVNSAGGNLHLMPTTNNVAGNTLPVEPFFMHTEGRYYRDKINSGRSEIVGDSYTYSSSYDMAEGWTSSDIGAMGTLSHSFTNLNAYTGAVPAPAPVLKINSAGNAVNPRYYRVKLNNDSIYGQTVNYYDYNRANIQLTTAQISGGTANIDITNVCNTAAVDRMVISQTELVYARQFNFGGATNFNFELPANAVGNYLEIAGFTHGGTAPVLYDLTNGKRYVGDITNPSLVKVALQGSATSRKLLLVSQAHGFTAIGPLQQRNFVNYATAANQGDFLMITHAALVNGSGANPVEDYRMYRSSAAGGGYNAKVYMIDQLIDQFGYGIAQHPLSIRNFLRWARVNYSIPLKNILLIGKGVSYNVYRVFEGVPDLAKLDLVPTFGYPASDILLSAEGGSSIPKTPIGRISVINKEELAAYLNKVKEFENVQQNVSSPIIEDMAWRKNIVHVTGASDDITTAILQTANEGFRRIIEDTLYGGKVYSFSKSSSESVQQLNGSQLSGLFEKGLGIITYFGHSSASTLEFNLDNPQNYNNPGKYPIMIVMGCNAGNFYSYNIARLSTKETISERYVLAPQRGSVAFLASTHLGIVHYLDIYNTRNYQSISYRNYGATIGEIMDDAIVRVFASTTENDFYARFQCEQFTLHGDPALKYYHSEKPDYAIEDQLVKISNSFISVADMEFTINASFANLGKAPSKNIVIRMKRIFPDNTDETRYDTIPGIRYLDSIQYLVQIRETRDKGLNKFEFTIDPNNEVDELYETNNTIVKEIYIYEDEIRPAYPYNFSIVNEQNPVLIASTANAFAEVRNYIMEMDTTELFNSPVKITRTTTAAGGIVEIPSGATFTDSTVYYWRIAQAVPTGDTIWNVSSFTYIDGTDKGFNQAHLYQHLKSTRTNISLDSTSRRWEFHDKTNYIFLRNGVYPYTSGDAAFYAGTINDVHGIINPGCNYDEIMINVIDPVTIEAMKNDYTLPGSFGLYESIKATCAGGREYAFQYFLSDTAWRRRAKNFLENVVPDGHIVIIRSNANFSPTGNTYSPVWKNDQSYWGAGNSLYHTLYNQGFAGIDSFYKPRSFIFIYKKNGQSEIPPYWAVSDSIFDGITGSLVLHAPDSVGYITSPLLGPAKAWNTLKWKGSSLDSDTTIDKPTLDIYGVTNTGVETLLFTEIPNSQQEVDLSSVDVTENPFLKIRMRNADHLHHTAYQLKSWTVTYDPVPEGAIAPNIYFTTKDTVEVGEPFNFGIAFKNISKVDFDSVKVKLTITDKDNRSVNVDVPNQKKLLVGDTIKLNVEVPTTSLSGHNTIFVNFNPDFHQPEHYLTNNFAFRKLFVRPDSLAPLMDVTFDGVHILNRDIVSAKPDIVIKLKDEAKWMRLDDSTLFNIQVKYPDQSLKRFFFLNNNDTLRLIPADQTPGTDNTASINFNPYFTQDGEYELLVSAKDRSDNSAGAIAYRVAFQVFNKPMISNMLNYPNPFTTSTAFVFTITGSQVPQNIRIQVLTITGKVVREITKDELGPLHIGRNITEFKWDGTDQYGSKLANGIYLYRVITNLNGKSLDKFKGEGDNTDKYFNNGYGKMYLMR